MLNLKRAAVFLSVVLIFLVLAAPAGAEGTVLNDLNGKTADISSHKGAPRLFLFWTTWCPYCRTEIQTLDHMAPKMQKAGIEVFAINVGELDHKVAKFIGQHMLTLRVLLDRDGRAADNYDVIGVPTYILLDKTGKVVAHENAFPDDYKNLLKE
ncbi:TlpA family protein disulfide reductase [bacterium]|nr:MAG: TlpA family protein disulfide reductase [bacterium]